MLSHLIFSRKYYFLGETLLNFDQFNYFERFFDSKRLLYPENYHFYKIFVKCDS